MARILASVVGAVALGLSASAQDMQVNGLLSVQGLDVSNPDGPSTSVFRGANGFEMSICSPTPDQIAKDFPIPTNPWGPDNGAGITPYGIKISRMTNDPNAAVCPRDFWMIPFFAGMGFEYGDEKTGGGVEWWVDEFSIRHGRYSWRDPGAVCWIGDDNDSGGMRLNARSGPGAQFAEVSSQKWWGESQGDLRFRVGGPSSNNTNSFLFTTGSTAQTAEVVGSLSGQGDLAVAGSVSSAGNLAVAGNVSSQGGVSAVGNISGQGDLSVAGAILTGNSGDRWVFRGVTVDKRGITSVHVTINGNNYRWALTPE